MDFSVTNFVQDTLTGIQIPFKFLNEGYGFSASEEETRETYSLLCQWEDRFKLAYNLTDGAYWNDSTLVRTLPAFLPSLATSPTYFTDNPLPVIEVSRSIAPLSTLFVTDIEEIKGVRPTGGEGTDQINATYELAKLTVVQKTLPYSVLDYGKVPALLGVSSTTPLTTDVYYDSFSGNTYILRYISRSCQRTDFTQSLKPGLVKVWDYSLGVGGAVSYSDPQLMTNSLDLKWGSPEYHLTWWKVPTTVNWGHHLIKYWSSFLGYVNQDIFDGHEPGSLLLTGLQVSPLKNFVNGQKFLDVTFLMKQRDVRHQWGGFPELPAHTAVGHNSFFRVDSSGAFQVQLVTHNGLSSGRGLFPFKYFYKLFSPPSSSS